MYSVYAEYMVHVRLKTRVNDAKGRDGVTRLLDDKELTSSLPNQV